MQVSPTLDLVRDYSRFVISFFEVISTAAPHIYHSALLLSPQTSITRRLYKQYASPFAGVVHGLPESWEPISASLYLDDFEGDTAWSPCGKFVAIAKRGSTEILDAVTLNPLKTFNFPHTSSTSGLSFSPDGCSLTQFSPVWLITWDVQTGGSLTTLESGSSWFPPGTLSLTYSMDGKMIAIAHGGPYQKSKNGDGYHYSRLITVFDLFGTKIHTCQIPEERIVSHIWAHGQCFRFATIKPSSITIWEVASPELVEVESLPAPDEGIEGWNELFFPTLSRLAFSFNHEIQIWDTKSSKPLLKSKALLRCPSQRLYTPYHPWCSFSLNGHSFACVADTGVSVWKESPSGYILHQKFAFILPPDPMGPCLSPDGESIIMPLHSTIHLWLTRDQVLPPSNAPAGDNVEGNPVLAFSPNKLFAAFARGSVVKILDLQSRDFLSSTDTGMKISCLWMSQNTVVVVTDGKKIVSWNTPGENCGIKSGPNVKDSAQTITLDNSSSFLSTQLHHISVSPDLSRIVVSYYGWPNELEIYDVFTGRCLGGIRTYSPQMVPKFTLDGHQIRDFECNAPTTGGWDIVADSKSGTIHLVPINLGGTMRQPRPFPVHSSCGYEVADDGWVLSPTQKRLLWVPQRWRSTQRTYRTWNGRFLGLTYPGLLDVVILEFFD